MTICSGCIQDDAGSWSASHCAVWVEEVADDDGNRQVAMLRHPTYPFERTIAVPADLAGVESSLRAVALSYLKAAQVRIGIHDDVINALDSGGTAFDWLGLSWGAGLAGTASRDPRGSFWVQRQISVGDFTDRTAVLLAGSRTAGGRALGGEVGLRIVMHILNTGQGTWRVRVSSLSSSDLPAALELARSGNLLQLAMLDMWQNLAKAYFGFDTATILGGVQRAASVLRLFGTGTRGADPEAGRSYSFVVDVEPAGSGFVVSPVSRVERLSHADVFERDPASCGPPESIMRRRPTRPATFVGAFRHSTDRLPALVLRDDNFEVRQTRIGNANGDPQLVQPAPAAHLALELRSDELAAAHAYIRGDDLFERLQAYGLVASEYFRLAKLPLLLRHRAPIRGAGDGKTINAQVRPVGDGLSIGKPWDPTNDERSALEVRFAAGELAHRQLLPNDAQRLRAQPLGLAADQRWAWHEFGHVLAFASTGALEFRFAHSAGDALAAVVADPDSELRDQNHPGGYAGNATFPWVCIPRRHDRDPLLGWCWCGGRNVTRLPGARAVHDQRLGYFQEQLLSSSLFRLYRCIGGDTFAEPASRRSAADYIVYLVMRAIALLGPETVVPARTADQLVSALIDADVGTGAWNIMATWPERDAPRNVVRCGGCVHKVIRWAFEMQGLYATEDPQEVKEGLGLPPCVDICIASRRGGMLGGYEPVPLLPIDGSPQPWHADPQAISLAAGKVIVVVRNRGQIDAQGVTVVARWGLAGAGLPVWNRLTPSPNPQQPQPVPAGGSALFAFDAVGANGAPLQPPFMVWASATCPADRSNDDLASGLACALQGQAPFVDLVANDNNQGLCIVGAV